MARQKGPFTIDQRPPTNRSGKREVERYRQKRFSILGGEPGIAWDVVDKAGSSLDEIETRPHEMLQDISQADVDAVDVVGEEHITNLLAYEWDRNRNYVANVAADFTAEVGQHISVTCSTVDITGTLPDATTNAGMPIWIHKTDATAFKVLTSVKDVAFQNSTMHLISNGTDWVIS